MRPAQLLFSVFALLLYLAPGATALAQLIAAGPAGLRMDVTARVTGAAGQVEEIPVNDDSVLRTGDGVQIRLRVARAAYVYVIVYGSSGSAIVLQPFSGKSEDAFMRAGEERIIPGPSRFLPLDRRAGAESLYAFASPEPVRFLSSLLVRMEARGADRPAVARILRSSHPETLALDFRHVEAQSTAARSPEPGPIGTAAGDAAPAGAPGATAFGAVEEEGVLSGEGSRIQALIGANVGSTPAPEPAPEAAPADTSETSPAPAARPEPEPSPAAGSGGWFGRLFGFESGDSKEPATAESSAGEEAPATTYALPATAALETGSVSAAADAPAAEVAADAPDVSTVPAGRPRPLVAEAEPAATAETGTAAAARRAGPTPVVPEPVDPQLNVSVLDAIVASLGETPERNYAGEVAAVPRIRAVTEPGGSPGSGTESPVAAMAAIDTSGGTTESGGGQSGGRPASGSAIPSGAGAQPTVAQAPSLPQVRIAGEAPASAGEAAEDSAESMETAPKTVVIGPATGASPEPAPQAASAVAVEAETPAEPAGETGAAPGAGNGETGILSGLASLFGSSPAQDSSPGSTAAVASPAPGAAEAGPSTERAGARPTEEPAPGAQDAEAESVAPASSGGLLGGLTGWFSRPPAAAAEADAGQQSGEQAPASPVVVTRPRPAQEPAPAAEPATAGQGLFGGLRRLFGGEAGEPQKADDQMPADTSSAQTEPTERPAGDEPTFKTVTRADGKQVVIVPGPPPRADAPPPSSEVLAGEGSKIRALLEPEKPAPSDENVVAEGRQQTTAPPQPSPAPAESPKTEASAGENAIPAGSVDTDRTASAATAAPAPDVSISPPAGAAAVAPDEVQTALEAGVGAERPAAETLAALTAPAPASEISVAPVQEIDVTAADNVSSSIVLVVTPTGTGSGVLLDDAGHVLANWHLVNGYSTVSVSFKSPNLGMPSVDRTFSARVLRLNKTADLALLQVDSPPADVLPVRFADANSMRPGDVLHAIGHPASGAWTHTLGKIDDIKPESSWYAGRNLLHRGTVIQAKVLDDPGSAGAPMFNNRMEFVGISAAARSKRGVLTGVSVDTIRLFLAAPPPGG